MENSIDMKEQLREARRQADFSGVTHYTQVDVQPGGINIQHVENLYQADILKQLGIELGC